MENRCLLSKHFGHLVARGHIFWARGYSFEEKYENWFGYIFLTSTQQYFVIDADNEKQCFRFRSME
ncbi:MAG: hypothetical protein LBB05_03690 [Puniceicoccales bacterium]|nr:hypothetical protein [Puniceicoccales bacterium]